VRDIEASRRFYRAALGALGFELTYEAPECFASDELFVSSEREVGAASTAPHRVHLAFQAPDREAVARFHVAALQAGGRDNGGVGERPYHPATTPRSYSIGWEQHRGRAPRPRRALGCVRRRRDRAREKEPST
jgi:catechol 2,3-dioxygenase-like lactoylglutathione lyase family enzyme